MSDTKLCYRCEHRVRALETNGAFAPRCECRDFGQSCHTCYMYRPVTPVTLRRARGDRRRFMYRSEAYGVERMQVHSIGLGAAKRRGAIRWVHCLLPDGWEPRRVEVAS